MTDALRQLIADLRWWADNVSARPSNTPWEVGLIALLRQAADALATYESQTRPNHGEPGDL